MAPSVQVELVREKVRRLREIAALLAACLPSEARALAGDRDRLDLVSFRVYLALQAAIDLASHLIANEGWGPAPRPARPLRDPRTHGVLRGPSLNRFPTG